MSDEEPVPGPHMPTTTHAGWGAGHPRLLVRGEHERYVHDLTSDLTRIGSAENNEIVLPGAEPLHATVTHDSTDEYIVTMFGEGETNAATRKGPGERRHPSETLRTGAQFSAGPWHLVFSRDEFADHGRPYGGRQGGEFAHQKRQGPRPDYTPSEGLSEDQLVLIDEVLHDEDAPAFEFYVVKDEKAGNYSAMVGSTEVGGLTYSVEGEGRLVLLALSVHPVYRNQGIASDLIRRVLDDVRTTGKRVTILCPIVHTFIGRNPKYAELIDPEHPGLDTVPN